MKNLVIITLIIGFLLIGSFFAINYVNSKSLTPTVEQEIGDNPSFIIYKTTQDDNFRIEEWDGKKLNAYLYSEYYLLQHNGQLLSKNSGISQNRTLRISLSYNQTTLPYTRKDIDLINHYLKDLYSGLQIEIVDTVKIEEWNPLILYQADNIYKELDEKKVINDGYDINIICIQDEPIFKYRFNFLAFRLSSIQNAKKTEMIFGNSSLFKDPFLFIHELVHTYELSDRNNIYKDVDGMYAFDIMFGEKPYCIKTLNLVDLFRIHGQIGVNELKELNFVYSSLIDTTRACYEINDICPCLNAVDNLDLNSCCSENLMQFVNFNQNSQSANSILNLPFEAFNKSIIFKNAKSNNFQKMINDDLIGLQPMNGINTDNLRRNFREEWEFFLKDDSILNQKEFIERKMRVFEERRKYNLISIIKLNLHQWGYNFNEYAYVNDSILSEEIKESIKFLGVNNEPVIETVPKPMNIGKGIIQDENRNPIPNAIITFFSPLLEPIIEIESDEKGEFILPHCIKSKDEGL